MLFKRRQEGPDTQQCNTQNAQCALKNYWAWQGAGDKIHTQQVDKSGCVVQFGVECLPSINKATELIVGPEKKNHFKK